MTPWVAGGLLLAALALPLLAGKLVERRASARQLVAFSIGSLLALAIGLVVTLAAVVDAATLPAGTVPALVGRCAEAAARIFSHPVGHWPQILAAVLLLALLGRLIYALVITVRRAQREVASVIALVGEGLWTADPPMVVIPVDEPVAFAAGFLRRRVVVSRGFFRVLAADEQEAVLEHERAHVRGLHSWLLTGAHIISMAYSFLPPVRLAARNLVLGLEMAADRAATLKVGDPLVVAGALMTLARERPEPGSSLSPAAARTSLAVRVDRLTDERRRGAHGRSPRWAPVLAVSLVVAFLVLPLTARGSAGAEPRPHGICHLPHA